MVRTLVLFTAAMLSVPVGAQPTPRGSGSPAPAETPAARPAKTLPKSEAVLPTGKTENRWGPFEGRVVDAESGDGIAGAAVIVFWQRAILNPVEEHMEFYDARWAVSDGEGRFTVPRRDPPLVTLGLTGVFLSCVAPGYLPYEFTPGYQSRVESARLREGPVTLRLRDIHLTHKERLRRLSEFEAQNLGSIPTRRFQAIAVDVNHQRASLGLPSILLRSGELQ